MDESLKTLKYVISIYRSNIVLLCILFSALIRSNRETLIFINNHSQFFTRSLFLKHAVSVQYSQILTSALCDNENKYGAFALY